MTSDASIQIWRDIRTGFAKIRLYMRKMSYSIVYPNDEPLASRNMNSSPIAPLLEEPGCFFSMNEMGGKGPGGFHPLVLLLLSLMTESGGTAIYLT